MPAVRLQKILSAAGVASRRAAEVLIAEGRVTVNGATVRELGTKADPASDEIRLDGRRVKLPERHRYVLLNKPRGYVTTRSDPERRPTVVDLLKGVREYLYPTGRLDYDSEGLVLLTNDGDLAAKLMHPSHGVERAYEARVRGVPDERALERLRRGVRLEGGRAAPAEVVLLSRGPAEAGPCKDRGGRRKERAVLSITLREGRNRLVRRMCEAIGHPVIRLRRVRIGPITDAGLKPGQFRDLTPREVERLKAAAEGHSVDASRRRTGS